MLSYTIRHLVNYSLLNYKKSQIQNINTLIEQAASLWRGVVMYKASILCSIFHLLLDYTLIYATLLFCIHLHSFVFTPYTRSNLYFASYYL